MNRYRVVKKRDSDYPNPVVVLKSETVKCLRESNEYSDWKGWIYCKTSDNEGWIPEQIIKRNKNRGLMLEDYDATEFYLEVGEVIVEEKVLNGWIWGYKEEKPDYRGWAPLNHIEKL